MTTDFLTEKARRKASSGIAAGLTENIANLLHTAHQDQIGAFTPGQIQDFISVTGLNGLIAMRLQQVMKQFHVQFVILDHENFFDHFQALLRCSGYDHTGNFIAKELRTRFRFYDPGNEKWLMLIKVLASFWGAVSPALRGHMFQA